MKRKLTFLLTAFLLLTGMNVWAQSRTNITDVLNRELTGVTGSTYTSWEGKTSNSDAVYAGQSAGSNESIQLRSNNSNSGIITTASGGTVSHITVTWNENTNDNRTLNVYGKHSAYTSPTELYSSSSDTQGALLGTIVKGTSTELEFTEPYEYLGLRSASGAMYLTEIDITWTTGGTPPQGTVAMPTFNPIGGTYYESLSVTISCVTEGATIYYTLDGTNPTEAGTVYTSAISISENTTVKAIAVKEGYLDSNIASATYIISDAPSVITIAEARALANDEYALVQGVVTFIDGKNVYIQDETAAIDLFLNANAPSTLALGDLVQAYGKKAIYKGLVELSNIDPNNAEQFSVISTGNELPLAVKTIAEILANSDAEGNLQATRVKVENATIGTINTSGNTPLTQDESTINIYKVPALTDIEAGDIVDVISIIGYFNAPQLRVALASDVVLTSTPPIPDLQLTVSTTELNDFNYILGAGPSTPKNFSVSGSNLVENVTLTAPQDFEICLNSENGYTSSMVLSPNYGTLASTTVYVRLKAGLSVGTYSGNLTIVSGELSHNIALSGTVDEMPISTISIAEARALDNDQYAQVEGTVTFIEGRNVYIQDETAGIDLFLNNNTVPTNLAIGDNVLAYGKRSSYNGLVELSGINGSNTDEFSILSSGNTLPLAVKTIAEVLEGGADALQCTRVKIENATIGAINTNGNTPLTQDGSTINIYKVPALTGIEEGDVVDVVSVIGYFNTPQLRVAFADDVTLIETPSSSTLTVTPNTLSDFEYEFEVGGPSDIQIFTVGGEQLTNNVSIFPSEHFEVSTQTPEMFEPENPAMIYIPESGSFYGIEICVRLKAGLEVGTYNEQIAIVSEESGTVYVSVSGVVTSGTPTPPPTPTEGEYVRISDLSQLVAGSYVVFAARFDDNASNYYAMSNTATGKPTGVLFTSANSGANEILPASISDEESNYYWVVGITSNGYTFTNAAGQTIGWTNSTNFAPDENTEWSISFETAGESAMVPNYNGFVISNNYNAVRCFALNSNHNFGPYSFTSNSNNSNYNFYLDLFVKTEGIEPPMPTVATPVFTPEAGTYIGEQTVTITCATEGATIYFSTISENGPWSLYTGAITVEESMTIWAYAVMDGYNNSTASASYIIQNGSTTTVTIFNQDWEEDWHGWTEVLEYGDSLWRIASYQGNLYANANGYNHPATVDWLISPAFDLDSYNNVVLTFRTATKFNGPILEVYFSNNYDSGNPDFSDITWSRLEGFELSQGNFVWAESGPINLDPPTYTGTNCYIAFKYTCTNEAAAAWEVDDIMLVGESTTTEPDVNVTPLTLSGFTYIEGNGPSGEMSFTVSGVNLSSNIIITEATHYEISPASDNGFNAQNTITLTPVDGIVEETTIRVRLKAGLAVGTYNNEYITVACDDVDNIQVTCSGTVTAQPVPSDDYIRINNVSDLADGNRIVFAARFDENATDYYAMSNTASSHPSGELFTSVLNGSLEVLPSSILNEEDNFYWTVNVTAEGYTFTNANGELIGYSSGTNFAANGDNTAWSIETGTSEGTAMVPNYTGFVIGNVNNPNRAFALNGSHNFGAYHIQNIAGETYNFFLDIFMQGEGGPCTVAAPTFNPAGGTYYEGQEVTITCATPGATIYYSIVSENGPWLPYTGDILVNADMTIWAYAVLDGCDPSPVVSAEYFIQDDITIIFNQDWEEEDWHGWTEALEVGDSLWHIASYQGNHYAYANGHNHPASIDWLISPAFDLSSISDAVLTFRTAKGYEGDTLGVFFSSDYDGDPANATWISLPCSLSTGNFTWIESGDIHLPEINETNCYIGFRYSSMNLAAAWEVDDIMLVANGSATPTPTLTATPNTLCDFEYMEGEGPSDSRSYTLSGANLEGEGNISVTVNEYFEISTNNEAFGETLEIAFADGTLVNQPVTIYVRMVEGLEAGNYTGTIQHEGGNAITEVSLCGTVHGDNEPNISAAMPLYIQGNNGSNNNRVPAAIQVTLLNLEPNTTYRYTNQLVDNNDGPETAGAGNVIYVSNDGFYRTTSPSLETEGNYGEFTTSANGSQIVWFMNEPTANARFTPGNHVYLRIRINDGHEGTEVANTFTTNEYATVLNFGTENDEYSGSAFYVKSEETPMSFAMLFSDANNYRPLYSTSIETTGVDYGSINQYADFYQEKVAGKDGWFGGILPNVNQNGVNRIVIWDLYSYSLNEYFSGNGQWQPEANTVNPTVGLDTPIFIDLTDDGIEEGMATNLKVWNTDHEFVVENSDDTHYNMTVYNVLGQPMMMKQINAGSIERISHNLASGVYVISLQNNRSTVSVKVIVR